MKAVSGLSSFDVGRYSRDLVEISCAGITFIFDCDTALDLAHALSDEASYDWDEEQRLRLIEQAWEAREGR